MRAASAGPGTIERLGQVSCPSGILLILDGGLAWMWSHDRQPLLPDWSEISSTANSSVDVALRGPDALVAGLTFDRSNHPLFLYDQPRDGLGQIEDAFSSLLRERGLAARLEPLPERVPHRKRVELSLEHGRGRGVVDFHGMWAAAIGDLPRDRAFPVLAQRMSGPDEDRWRRIWIDVRQGEIASSCTIGHVLVDEARLMAVDTDALGAWDDHEPLDGRADFVFWGRDAAAVANELDAPEVPGEPDQFGWLNLPLDDALERGQGVEAARGADRKFATDFRPHTHHWQVMRDVRSSPTESGVLELAGAQLCMFMTSWGDGGFPVEADLDASGQVVRIRIEVGCDVIVERQREMEEFWFGDFAKLAIVSARVASDGMPVRFLYRQSPDHANDSGWRIFAGDETDDYASQPDNSKILPLREVMERDAALKQVLRTAAPCAFERETAEAPFGIAEGFVVGDE